MSEVLSSDVLEAQFNGQTRVEVLHQDEKERIICTKLVETGQVLEVSHVKFISDGIDQFPSVHQTIMEGQSMGKAFRTAGVPFAREMYAGYKYDLPDNFGRLFENDKPAAVIGVRILVGTPRVPYADILETY